MITQCLHNDPAIGHGVMALYKLSVYIKRDQLPAADPFFYQELVLALIL
jgi:hypothetical protein